MSGYLPFLGCGDGGAVELGASRLRGGGPAEELPHPGYDGLPALGQPRHLRRASPLPLRLRLLLDDGKDSAAWLVNNSSRTTSMPHTESKPKLQSVGCSFARRSGHVVSGSAGYIYPWLVPTDGCAAYDAVQLGGI